MSTEHTAKNKVMMTEEEVRHVAALARLRLTDEEVAKAKDNVSGVLSHFSTIQKIDTSSAAAAEDVSGLQNIVRKDEAKDQTLCSNEDLLARVPLRQGRHVQVRSVL